MNRLKCHYVIILTSDWLVAVTCPHTVPQTIVLKALLPGHSCIPEYESPAQTCPQTVRHTDPPGRTRHFLRSRNVSPPCAGLALCLLQTMLRSAGGVLHFTIGNVGIIARDNFILI